eukprot:m.144067 g.144067  ORF g.144067 m.144067 type:complete len:345 (+) comp16186_c0_seq2:111-1145(+)
MASPADRNRDFHRLIAKRNLTACWLLTQPVVAKDLPCHSTPAAPIQLQDGTEPKRLCLQGYLQRKRCFGDALQFATSTSNHLDSTDAPPSQSLTQETPSQTSSSLSSHRRLHNHWTTKSVMDWRVFAQQPLAVQSKAIKRASNLSMAIQLLPTVAEDIHACLSLSLYTLVDLLLQYPVLQMLSKVEQALDRHVCQVFGGIMMAVPDKVAKHVVEQLWRGNHFSTHHRTLLVQAMSDSTSQQTCLQALSDVAGWCWQQAKNDLLQTLSKSDCSPSSPQQPSWVWRCLAATQGSEMHSSVKFGKLLQQTMVRHSKCWPMVDAPIRILVQNHTSFMKKALLKALPHH